MLLTPLHKSVSIQEGNQISNIDESILLGIQNSLFMTIINKIGHGNGLISEKMHFNSSSEIETSVNFRFQKTQDSQFQT